MPKQYQLLHDTVRVRKCFRDHARNADGSVLIYRPEDSRADNTDESVWTGTTDITNWAEIIDVGPECKIVTKRFIGWRVLCPEQHNDMKRLVQDDFIIKESLLKFVVEPAGVSHAE